jgi:uncharacterized protein (DUF488 family)
MGAGPLTIWTVGHSTLAIEDFIALLANHGILNLADVRMHPGSRRFPHFNAAPFAAALREAGIAYAPFHDLGGRRPVRPDSPNTAWKNASFRGYADFMQTPEFASALERLIGAASKQPTAIMCAEALWWRCHRSLIADALKVRGIHVRHIMSNGPPQDHPYTAPATIVDGKLSYAGNLRPEPPGLLWE